MAKCPIPLFPCQSSQIAEIGHDPATNTLGVRFHRKKGPAVVYTYGNVDPKMFEEMKSSPSIGTYFGQKIRGREGFPTVKIIESEDDQA